jgi:RimJ/RimL family protein N-acetyltransferase
VTFSLHPASAVHFARLAAGEAPEPGIFLPAGPIADPAVLEMLGGLAETIRAGFDPAAWLILDGERLVGLLSLTTVPAEGAITIGYGISPSERGRGAATGAVRALLDWARSDPRVERVEAETRTDNIPSQRVLELNGFARIGERVDEENGALFCWRIEC